MKKLRVLLDMDCVLADFVGGVAHLWDTDRPTLERLQPAGEYNYDRALAAFRAEQLGLPVVPLAKGEFWRPINECPGFWAGLDPLPWAHELFVLCAELAGANGTMIEGVGSYKWTDIGGLYVVTSPSRCPGCVREKEDWLARHFGLPHDRMIPTPHKELMAVYQGVRTTRSTFEQFPVSAVLVDDYDRNCAAFDAAGGHAITLPARHNRLYGKAADPLPHVRAELEWALNAFGV